MTMRSCVRRLLFVLLFFSFLLLFQRSCPNQIRIGSGKLSDPDSLQISLQRQELHFQWSVSNLTRDLIRLKTELRRSIRPAQKSLFSVDLREFLWGQLSRAQGRSGAPLPDEFSVLPFQSFSLHRLLQMEPGLNRAPEESRIPHTHTLLNQAPDENRIRPDQRLELDGALEAALHLLNRPRDGDSRGHRSYSPRDFQQGLFRTERDTGTLYDLSFRESGTADFRRMVFFRPFGPLVKVKEDVLDASQILINIIVPMTGTVDALRLFVQHFSEECIPHDGQTHLTIIVFGSEKMEEAREVLEELWRSMRYRNVTLLRLGEFSSIDRALDSGVRSWKHGNVLLLFCDIHARFSAEFLQSCRTHTQPGQKVFYPVMFGLYNPDLAPPAPDKMVIKKDFGFWREDDFTVTCQYRSDFLNIGGFGKSVTGSSAHDLRLYRKFVQSSLIVIRVPSRGLFHTYHPTVCDDHLSSEAFKVCVQNKGVREASSARLGLMISQEQIHNHLEKYSRLAQ